ncbi:MAG: hypothetical protein NTX63_04675 [Candidatus Peregrinibacteria bacterium]|nr:hypothetical protein [Candidatus Peregrinibacteria bacterium]
MSGEQKVRTLAALCYVPFAAVVPCLLLLLWYPHSDFAMYHIKQGFSVFMVWFVSLFFVWMFLMPGLLFWLVLLFYAIKIGNGAFHGLKPFFPGLRTISPLVPAESVYRHLTGEAFPRH